MLYALFGQLCTEDKTNVQIFTLLADGEDDDNGGGEDGNDDCQQYPFCH